MQSYVISVSSITYAIKGRDFLRRKGFKAYIEKKTNTKGNAGCGYVIIVQGDREKITNALAVADIKFTEINTTV